MANEQEQKQCAHPGCNCTVAQDEKWCSPHCETAPTEALCGCGHTQCVAGAPVERAQTA
jgi:hypothetical protein